MRVDIALQYNFLFSETQVEVISGKQEGVYAWIGVNYALHKFDHISTGYSLLFYSVKYLKNEYNYAALQSQRVLTVRLTWN